MSFQGKAFRPRSDSSNSIRYNKARGRPTLYVCGTDEYGTATETKALEEKITPEELCAKYNKIHAEVYEWFEIGFDIFGRTPTKHHTEIAQDVFLKLYKNSLLTEKTKPQSVGWCLFGPRV